jgi:hypothetical protein
MPEPAQLTVLGPVMEKIQTHLAWDVERDLDARLASIEGCWPSSETAMRF